MTKIKIFKEKREIDLSTLIDSRFLICANSGGGKSYAVRKLLEETHGKVMSLVLDIEGEFKTLREKFDFLLVGENGDVPLNQKAVSLLPRKLLELNVSSIIDISDLKRNERIQYAKMFLEALMECPRTLWKPCLVILDEAHILAGQQEKQDSTFSVIDLMTRGRKRGFCGVLCTQRISKLHKDAVAECNNVMIGRTGLDIDMKRASEILGFTSKQDMLSLRGLDAGEFYVFGTAISREVTRVKVGEVRTTHPKVGMDLKSKIVPPTKKIKDMLIKLSDLPQEAKKEYNTIKDYREEINDLRFKLRKRPKPELDQKRMESISIDSFNKGLRAEANNHKAKIADMNKRINIHCFDLITDVYFSSGTKKLTKRKAVFVHHLKGESIPEVPNPSRDVVPIKPKIGYNSQNKDIHGYPKELPKDTYLNNEEREEKITGGALRMLNAAAMFHPNEITRARMGAIAGLSFKSGSFGTYLATLKRNGLILVSNNSASNNSFTITEKGLEVVGDVEELPTDSETLVSMWCNIVKGGASRMLKSLSEVYPDNLTKEELGREASISHTSGSFGTYLATLKRNGLIKVNGQEVKASDELFE